MHARPENLRLRYQKVKGSSMTKMGRPKKDTMSINVRLSQVMIERIDMLRDEKSERVSRPEQIRQIIEDWFERSERPEE